MRAGGEKVDRTVPLLHWAWPAHGISGESSLLAFYSMATILLGQHSRVAWASLDRGLAGGVKFLGKPLLGALRRRILVA